MADLQKASNLIAQVAYTSTAEQKLFNLIAQVACKHSLDYGAFSSATAGSGTLSWSHSPVGTAKGILVFIIQDSGSTDEVTGVTYGGIAMTEVTGSPNTKATGESGAVYGYFLNSGIPAGVQTVQVSVDGTGSTKCAGCISILSDDTTIIEDIDVSINTDSQANPSCGLSLDGNDCFCIIGFFSGSDHVAGIYANSGWTELYEYDFGSTCAGIYKYDTIDTSDVTAGWTQGAEDALAIAIAIKTNTAPVKASNPDPEDDETGVAVDKILSWDGNGDSYDVYLGTSSPLGGGDLVSEGQSGKTYDPPGDLDYDEEYFWRIDTIKEGFDDVTGDEWSFETESEPAGSGNMFLIF